MNPFRTGQLVMFQVQYDRSWHFFELIFFILIGVFGGLYGALVIKWNLRVQAFRKKYLSQHAVVESVVLAAITAVICFPNVFLKINMTEMMEILFQECEGEHDYHGLCESVLQNPLSSSLLIKQIQIPLVDGLFSSYCYSPAYNLGDHILWLQSTGWNFCSIHGDRGVIWPNGWHHGSGIT